MRFLRFLTAAKEIFVLFCIVFSVFVLAGLAVSAAVSQKEKDATYKELELFADAVAFVQTQ